MTTIITTNTANANTTETMKPQIRSTTSTERTSLSTAKKMIAFDTKGNLGVKSAGNFYSSFIETGDLVSIDIPEMEDNQMINVFRYILKNGIIVKSDKFYAINNEHTKAGTLSKAGEVETIDINRDDIIYEICWVSPSMINSRTLLLCRSDKRKEFEKNISCGYIHEGMTTGKLNAVMGFVSRMNTCSGATMEVPNSSIDDIGVIVVQEKPKFRDGQFYGYFPQLENNTAYQFRVFNGAGKGMLLNSKKLFNKHLKLAQSKDHVIIGNENNIVAVMDLNSYKMNGHCVLGNCYIMSEAHTSNAQATSETVKALVQKGYNKNALQKACEDDLLKAVYEACLSKDSDYILSAFAGYTQKATEKLIEDSLKKATFKFGVKYVKLLQAEDDILVRYKEVDGKKYPCVDCTETKEGLTLLERKPSTSMAESIVVYNLPGCYNNVFSNTVMIPSCAAGLDMATCMGGADYDGDGVFTGHNESIVKEMIQNGYIHKTIEVVSEPAADISINSYAELIFFLYTQQAANINKVVGTFKKFQFATKESLVKAFGGESITPKFAYTTIDKSMVQAITNMLAEGVKMSNDEDVSIVRKTIMEIARYMAETEISFGKKGVHAPADIFKFFAIKAKEVEYDPNYDIDWESAKSSATSYANDYFANTRLLSKEDVTMTKRAEQIGKAMANIMRAKMNGHTLATLGFDSMIRNAEDDNLKKDCIRAAFNKGYEASMMTDECLETLDYEVIDKNYDLNMATVNIGRRIEKSAVGAKVSFIVDSKGCTWMQNRVSKALVLGPIPKNKDVYEIIDVYNNSAYTDNNGISRENTVVMLKKA